MSVKADGHIYLRARKCLDQIRRLREMTGAGDSRLLCDPVFFRPAVQMHACFPIQPSIWNHYHFLAVPLSGYTSTSVDELPSF